ncbi:MAG: DUF5522 domain-containing protein [Bacteroidota bacterium]
MKTSQLSMCARCNSRYERVCRQDVLEQADQAQVSTETHTYLEATNYDHLCPNCLLELNQLIATVTEHEHSGKDKKLEEKVHYYLENGLWVFTEFYHLQRGYCCQSGCRHCAYGYKK